VIKLIGTILGINVTLVFGQVTKDPVGYRISHDTLTLHSSWSALNYPFGAFKNYEHLKSYYPEFCSKKDDFYYLKDGNSYAKLFRDDRTESVGLIYARIYSPKIKTSDGVVIGMTKQDVLKKFFKTLPDKLDAINVLKLEFEQGPVGIWHYYKFENNILTSMCLDTSYRGDKN
jgi:hypothetical protein